MDEVRLRHEHYTKLRTVHHRVLLRTIGAQRKRPDHRMTSYNRAFGKLADCVQSDIRAFGITGDWKRWRWRLRCGLKRPKRAGGGPWPRGGNKR